MHWQVIIPVKSPPNAKTRLFRTALDTTRHALLVRAIQHDTIDAVLAARELAMPEVVVAGVHVVGTLDTVPPDVRTLRDGGGGLNAVLEHAHDAVRQEFPEDAIAIVVADLPALRPDDLLAVLDEAQRVPRGYVADWHGTGTTMLTSLAGEQLAASFGPGSAVRHAESGAARLAAPESTRSDVDTESDLRRCVRIGLGPRTSDLVRVHLDAG